MVMQLVLGIVVVGLFAAALLWGEDSRIDFADPRRRESGLVGRRRESH